MPVITFSRFFPVKHPRAGEPTNFVEKMLRSLYGNDPDEQYEIILSDCNGDISTKETLVTDFFFSLDWKPSYEPKHHTVRAGNRWKVGDKFSPRVWSGKPYASKQIQIAPDIEIKKIWNFKINKFGYFINDCDCNTLDELTVVATNDGLEVDDFENWFAIHPKTKNDFRGQILCWNESISY